MPYLYAKKSLADARLFYAQRLAAGLKFVNVLLQTGNQRNQLFELLL